MTDHNIDKPKVQILTIEADSEGQRLDNFLRKQLKGVPKSAIYRVIRKGQVRINGKRAKAETKLAIGDDVRVPPVRVAETQTQEISPQLQQVQRLAECIIYEDDSLLIVNKPSGTAVHGGSGLSFGVIEAFRALRPACKFLELVHRLDRDTSGILLLAKKRSALKHLHKQLQDKTVSKDYQALVKGHWPARVNSVNYPLRKNTLQSGERIVRVDVEQGKPSLTRIKLLRSFVGASLIQASPVTGRTHQIRVHAAASGHPIACDPKYGVAQFSARMQQLGLNRLFLHASRIRFTHPATDKPMDIVAPLPVELQRTVDLLADEA